MNTNPIRLVILLIALSPIIPASVAETKVRHNLAEFGDVRDPVKAQEALTKAMQQLEKEGGGILEIPPHATEQLIVINRSQNKVGDPSVTVMDYRKGNTIQHLPPIGDLLDNNYTGLRKERVLNLGRGTLPFGGSYALEAVDNITVSGCGSYMQYTDEACQKGKNAVIYLPSIRSISVGMHLTVSSKPYGYGAPYDRTTVKSIGWDAKKRKHFITADLEHDHPSHVIIYNKHVVGCTDITSPSNADSQTMDFQLSRHQFGVGDNFLVSAGYHYMGDVFSGLGDEGGICFNAETIQSTIAFRSKIESFSPKTDELIYEPGSLTYAQTLATSRPIINLNPKKWITGGKVVVVRPNNGWGGELKASKDKKYVYRGKAYPSLVKDNINLIGGLIEGGKDCDWSEEIIGRYFALAEKSEVISPDEPSGSYIPDAPSNLYRWYQIKEFHKNDDGTKTIRIERVRWAAVAAGACTLFDDENYSYDGHVKPLSYIIAPGAYPYDISQGWVKGPAQGNGSASKSDTRKLFMGVNGDRNTKFDFEAGDPIEQAVGPDPWHPVGLRCRQFPNFPGIAEQPHVALVNLGRVQMPSAIQVAGNVNSPGDLAGRKDHKPTYGHVLDIGTYVESGVHFINGVQNAAVLFESNKDPQPLKWMLEDEAGAASFYAEPRTGAFVFKNTAGLQEVRGISGGDKPARNLRGINVKPGNGSKKLTVKFSSPESDANYSISVAPTWLTSFAVTSKRADGFDVEFEKATPAEGAMDWQLIR